MKKLILGLLVAVGLFAATVSPAYAKCDNWAEPGSTHRNAGNGCTYTCNGDSWSGPQSCDGQGNGQFQGATAKSEEERRQQAAAVAQRNEEAKQKVAEQGAAGTAAIAAQTAQQRNNEAARQQAMVETQRQQEIALARRAGASEQEIAQISNRYLEASKVVSSAQGTNQGAGIVGSDSKDAAQIAAEGYGGSGTSTTKSTTSSGGGGGGGYSVAGTYSDLGSCEMNDENTKPNTKGLGGRCCRGGVTECKSGTCGAPANGMVGKCVEVLEIGGSLIEIPPGAQAQADTYKKLVRSCQMDSDNDSLKCGQIPDLEKRLNTKLANPTNAAEAQVITAAKAEIQAELALYGATNNAVVKCGSYAAGQANYTINSSCPEYQAVVQQQKTFCEQYPDRCKTNSPTASNPVAANIKNYQEGLQQTMVIEAKEAKEVTQRANDYLESYRKNNTCVTGGKEGQVQSKEKQEECFARMQRDIAAFYAPYTDTSSAYCLKDAKTCAGLVKEKEAKVVQTQQLVAAMRPPVESSVQPGQAPTVITQGSQDVNAPTVTQGQLQDLTKGTEKYSRCSGNRLMETQVPNSVPCTVVTTNADGTLNVDNESNFHCDSPNYMSSSDGKSCVKNPNAPVVTVDPAKLGVVSATWPICVSSRETSNTTGFAKPCSKELPNAVVKGSYDNDNFYQCPVNTRPYEGVCRSNEDITRLAAQKAGSTARAHESCVFTIVNKKVLGSTQCSVLLKSSSPVVYDNENFYQCPSGKKPRPTAKGEECLSDAEFAKLNAAAVDPKIVAQNKAAEEAAKKQKAKEEAIRAEAEFKNGLPVCSGSTVAAYSRDSDLCRVGNGANATLRAVCRTGFVNQNGFCQMDSSKASFAGGANGLPLCNPMRIVARASGQGRACAYESFTQKSVDGKPLYDINSYAECPSGTTPIDNKCIDSQLASSYITTHNTNTVGLRCAEGVNSIAISVPRGTENSEPCAVLVGRNSEQMHDVWDNSKYAKCKSGFTKIGNSCQPNTITVPKCATGYVFVGTGCVSVASVAGSGTSKTNTSGGTTSGAGGAIRPNVTVESGVSADSETKNESPTFSETRLYEFCVQSRVVAGSAKNIVPCSTNAKSVVDGRSGFNNSVFMCAANTTRKNGECVLNESSSIAYAPGVSATHETCDESKIVSRGTPGSKACSKLASLSLNARFDNDRYSQCSGARVNGACLPLTSGNLPVTGGTSGEGASVQQQNTTNSGPCTYTMRSAPFQITPDTYNNGIRVVDANGKEQCAAPSQYTAAEKYQKQNCEGATMVFDIKTNAYACPSEKEDQQGLIGAACDIHGQQINGRFCCDKKLSASACSAPAPDRYNVLAVNGNVLGGRYPEGTWCGYSTDEVGCKRWCEGGKSFPVDGKAVCGTSEEAARAAAQGQSLPQTVASVPQDTEKYCKVTFQQSTTGQVIAREVTLNLTQSFVSYPDYEGQCHGRYSAPAASDLPFCDALTVTSCGREKRICIPDTDGGHCAADSDIQAIQEVSPSNVVINKPICDGTAIVTSEQPGSIPCRGQFTGYDHFMCTGESFVNQGKRYCGKPGEVEVLNKTQTQKIVDTAKETAAQYLAGFVGWAQDVHVQAINTSVAKLDEVDDQAIEGNVDRAVLYQDLVKIYDDLENSCGLIRGSDKLPQICNTLESINPQTMSVDEYMRSYDFGPATEYSSTEGTHFIRRETKENGESVDILTCSAGYTVVVENAKRFCKELPRVPAATNYGSVADEASPVQAPVNLSQVAPVFQNQNLEYAEDLKTNQDQQWACSQGTSNMATCMACGGEGQKPCDVCVGIGGLAPAGMICGDAAKTKAAASSSEVILVK